MVSCLEEEQECALARMAFNGSLRRFLDSMSYTATHRVSLMAGDGLFGDAADDCWFQHIIGARTLGGYLSEESTLEG